MDQKSEKWLASVYPDIKDQFLLVHAEYLETHKKVLKISAGKRAYRTQSDLYAKGRTKPGEIVTNSRPGWSWHNYGLAIDVFFQGKDPYMEKSPKFDFWWKEYGRIAESRGFVWGGHFSGLLDRPHIQLSYGMTIIEAIKTYNKNWLISDVWKKIDKIRGV